MTRSLLICIFFIAPNPEFKIPGISLYLVDVFITLFILLSFFKKRTEKISTKLYISVYLILSGYALGGLRSYDPDAHFIGLAQYLFVLLFMIAVHNIEDRDDLSRKCLTSFMLGSLLAIFLSMLAFYGAPFPIWFKYTTGYRFGGVWENPNVLMKQLSVAILLGVFFIRNWCKTSVLLRVTSLIVCLLSVQLGLLAASFGGLASYAVALILAAFVSLKSAGTRGKILMSCVFALIGLLISAFVFNSETPAAFERRIKSAETIDDAGSAQDKISQFSTGLELFLVQPLVGVGVENGRYLNSERMGAFSSHISFHSFYITVALEGAVVSIFGFIGLFYFLYVNPKNVFLKELSTALALLFLFNLIVHTNIYNRMYWVPIAILCLKYQTFGAPKEFNSHPSNHRVRA